MYSEDVESLITHSQIWDDAGTNKIKVYIQIAFKTGGTKVLDVAISGGVAV